MDQPIRTIANVTLTAVIAIIIGAALRGSVLTLFSGPLSWANSMRVRISNTTRSLTQIDELRTEKQSLQAEVADLRQQLSKNAEVIRENEALRKEIGATTVSRDLPKVIAQVISQTGSVTDRGFLISAGKNQGVAAGQAVLANGYLIGRVSVVQSDIAEVRSITSRQSVIQTWVSTTGAKGLLRGDGNVVTFEGVEPSQQIAENAILETSGLGGTLPRGILIGSVSQKLSSTTDLTQAFRATLGSNPNDATTVFVITTNQ